MHHLLNARRLFLVVCVVALLGAPKGDTQAATIIRTIDSGGSVGSSRSLALTSSGNPVISYVDYGGGPNRTLKLALCADPTCSSATLRTVDSGGDVGVMSSLALTESDTPVISYLDYGNFDLKLAVCADPTCSSATLRTVDSAGDVGLATSLALTASGNPVITYYDRTNLNLKLAVCADPTCSSATLRTVDSAGHIGSNSSLTLSASGNPLISYIDVEGWLDEHLKLAVCVDPTCSSATLRTVDSPGWVGAHISLALTASGNPVISYFYSTYPYHGLKLAVCVDPTCTSATLRSIDGAVGSESSLALTTSSLALTASGNPVISYLDPDVGYDLKLAVCTDPTCSSAVLRIVDSAVGSTSSLALTASGNPVISFTGGPPSDLRLAVCDNPTCNNPPILSADAMSVAVDEGQLATNTGTVSDPDGDTVQVTASTGIVMVSGNQWVWQFPTSDGPTESQVVTIYGDDLHGGTNAVTFGLAVDNVAPSVNAGADATINEGDTFTVNASFTDPGTADTHTGAIDFGLGGGLQPATLTQGVGSGTVSGAQSYTTAGTYPVTVCVSDNDGATGCDQLTLTVLPPPEPTIADLVIQAAAGDPEEFTILLAALQAADPSILALLDDPGQSLTVFAPTDAAFTALFNARGVTVAQFLADTAMLNDVLRYHIVPGVYDEATLFALSHQEWPNPYIRTLQGTYVEFTDDEGTLVVDSAWVVTPEVIASNGIIHVLGAVLDPSYVWGEEGLP